MTLPTSSRSGKKISKLFDAGFDQLARCMVAVSSLIGFDQHFAGRHVDHVGGDVGAFEIVRRDFHLLDLGLLDFLDRRWR